jgi:hypothetical protein
MQKLISILTFAIISIWACSKDASEDYYWGTSTAEFNGNAWEAEPRASINLPYKQGINFSMQRFDRRGTPKESLSFFKIPNQLGRYKLSETETRVIDSLSGVRLFTLIGGDVLGDVYYPLEGIVDNYLEITKIKGDQIWADFQVALVRTGAKNLPDYPDTIVVTNGRIHTRMMSSK